ncbi:hypothetical protein RGQ15_11500 [Paracoccus sp. MBLB3053]|uniref:HTH cro/C1-type domain-containing protein n=1 Tax=Paracoccus aurantius TaxID=3073814 RepID=A0ABU2HT18_9RHOB|nr:hypothetical protein [Paracoccus sp. MBLB3053]MDS9468191.1 hypothetical protein [Paracoccus sp. MBLB3053]
MGNLGIWDRLRGRLTGSRRNPTISSDEREQVPGAVDTRVQAHALDDVEPTGRKTTVGHSITDGRDTDADRRGNLTPAKSLTDRRDRGGDSLIHADKLRQIFWRVKVQTTRNSQILKSSDNAGMDIETKTKLAHLNDMGLAATAIRLRAAFLATGIPQLQEFARAAKISRTVLSNALSGSTYPNRDVMKYLYRSHRIDFNFIMNGDFSQLPGDVQEKLFPALEVAKNEWDQRESSS